jgi:Phosphotransferase enzyme family
MEPSSLQHPEAFPEQNWRGIDFYPKRSRERILSEQCIENTNWDALLQYASALNGSVKCTLHPTIAAGRYYIVRLLEFEDKTRWVAKIRPSKYGVAKEIQSEIDTMALLRERTKAPVPRVFGYEIDKNNPIGFPFILTEFFPGNTALDANGGYKVNHYDIPQQHRATFINEAAQLQVIPLIWLCYCLTPIVGTDNVRAPTKDRNGYQEQRWQL